jgi:hypothetical protein
LAQGCLTDRCRRQDAGCMRWLPVSGTELNYAVGRKKAAGRYPPKPVPFSL